MRLHGGSRDFGECEEKDEDKEQTVADKTYKRENQDHLRQTIALEALQTGVHCPATVFFFISLRRICIPVTDLVTDPRYRVQDSVSIGAEDSAESCLDHRDRSDVPENCERRQRFRQDVTETAFGFDKKAPLSFDMMSIRNRERG